MKPASAPTAQAAPHALAGPVVSTGKPWTTREVKILREVLPTRGVNAAVAELPGRSRPAVQQQAYRLQLAAPNQRHNREPWPITPQIDEAVRRVYQDPTPGAIRRLEQTIGRPRQWIRKRAEQLGIVVPRFKEPEWTEAEDALLRQHASKHIDRIANILRGAGYKRTACAVRVRLYSVDNIDRERIGVFTASDVARCLGVNSKTPTDWIEKGWLTARRRKTEVPSQHGDRIWEITRADLRRFVIDHVAHVDFRKVDKFFIVELLARAK